MPKRPAPPSAEKAPCGRKPRSPRPVTLAKIRAANPNLDDVQGARAALQPPCLSSDDDTSSRMLQHLDAAADLLRGCETQLGSMLTHRVSEVAVPPTALQLYSVDDSPELLSAAVKAGFFCFGSPYELPGRAPEDRGASKSARDTLTLPCHRFESCKTAVAVGCLKSDLQYLFPVFACTALLNLELGGPSLEPDGEDPGGRIVLDLSDSSTDTLIIGKRSTKSIRQSNDTAAGKGFSYRLSVNEAFEQSWQAIVDAHGYDWLGFRNIRASYHAMHYQCPYPWEDTPHKELRQECQEPLMLSIELWDAATGCLVSAEVGCLVGRCYCCLSLFANTAEYPVSQQVQHRRWCCLLFDSRCVVLPSCNSNAVFFRVQIHNYLTVSTSIAALRPSASASWGAVVAKGRRGIVRRRYDCRLLHSAVRVPPDDPQRIYPALAQTSHACHRESNGIAGRLR
eukprot:SAG31_NODE_310_length_17887_cov_4.623060_21_plen_453_part_00